MIQEKDSKIMNTCKEYEKLWSWNEKEMCVDRNLKDDWLIRWNTLRTLEMVSTCEGHPSVCASGFIQYSYPTLQFKLKGDLLSKFEEIWQPVGKKIADFIQEKLSDELTTLALWRDYSEIRPIQASQDLFTGKWDFFDLEIARRKPERVCLRIDSKRQRNLTDMEPWVANWFEEKTRALEQVDSALLKYLEPNL